MSASEIPKSPKSPLRETDQSQLLSQHSVESRSKLTKEKVEEQNEKELPEPMRPASNMMTMPPINVREVKDMLCSPNMPEQKIMKQVVSKLTSMAYNSDDGGSDGESKVGMQGIFDCIIETTLCQSDHSDSESSDDEENVPRQLICAFCEKIFVSNMRLTTHILMMHSRQDPSLLNVKTTAAPRKELQRSLSKGKSTNASLMPEVKGRSNLQSSLNVDIPSITGEAIIKNMSPRQRHVKMSPKVKIPSKDETVQRMKDGMTIPDSSTLLNETKKVITPPTTSDVSCPRNMDNPILENTPTQISSSTLPGQISPDLMTSQQEDPTDQSKATNLRGKSSSPVSSSIPQSSPVTRSRLNSGNKESKPITSSRNTAPKRKSIDSSQETGTPALKKSNKTSGSSPSQARQSSSRRSR